MYGPITWFRTRNEFTDYVHHVMRSKRIVYKIGKMFGFPIWKLIVHDMEFFNK